MVEEIKIVQVGLGPIGLLITRHIANERKGMKYVGAVDIDPELLVSDLGDVADVGRKMSITISDESKAVFDETNPDIAIYSTVSSVKKVLPQMKPAIESGIDIISTAEQLAYPKYSSEELTNKYDQLAKKHDVSILGTGINPGFLMDIRPKVLTSGCTEVKKIRVTRQMNATLRRKPFQEKIGVSMKPGEFKEAVKSGKITGHVGLEESILLIASGIGWKLDEIIVDDVKPVVAEEPVSSEYHDVKSGELKGVRQNAVGKMNGEVKIELVFNSYLDADPSFDEVEIDGTPQIVSRVCPCWHGDYGTVAMIVNLIPTVLNAPAGMLTMNDLVPISFKQGNLG